MKVGQYGTVGELRRVAQGCNLLAEPPPAKRHDGLKWVSVDDSEKVASGQDYLIPLPIMVLGIGGKDPKLAVPFRLEPPASVAALKQQVEHFCNIDGVPATAFLQVQRAAWSNEWTNLDSESHLEDALMFCLSKLLKTAPTATTSPHTTHYRVMAAEASVISPDWSVWGIKKSGSTVGELNLMTHFCGRLNPRQMFCSEVRCYKGAGEPAKGTRIEEFEELMDEVLLIYNRYYVVLFMNREECH